MNKLIICTMIMMSLIGFTLASEMGPVLMNLPFTFMLMFSCRVLWHSYCGGIIVNNPKAVYYGDLVVAGDGEFVTDCVFAGNMRLKKCNHSVISSCYFYFVKDNAVHVVK